MNLRNKKKKKVDLLEMSDVEKIRFIRQIKESLQQKVVEAKMWQSFIDTENLTINGEAVNIANASLKGSLCDLVRSI